MFKNYSKDQRRVLLGACLYYMGLGGFLFNSQTSVLAAVRSLYQFPMTRISLYTTIGYVATILGATLMGPMIFRLSQKKKKLYFEGMYLCGAAGILILAFFAETPLFYLARFLMSLSVSTISIIISYILNQWIQVRTGTAIGIASAFAGVGGMLSNPLSAFLFGRFSFQKGIIILVLLSACLIIPSFILLFMKPVPEGIPVKPGRKDTAETDETGSSLLVLIIL
ncbi:MAG: MFS transporter, partial [Solobacterium sp.]|nr:MFS transporter [Solobacterium sp.]